MTKRFVIAATDLTDAQEKEFIEYIRSAKAGWWHWIPNFWLVTNSHETLNVADIRDAIGRINDEAMCLVMEIEEDITWAARSPTGTTNMTKWLKSTWPKEPD